MAAEGAAEGRANNDKKKRKPQYLSFNRPSKKSYSGVRPGVQGFFLTCDGGREHQARNEALGLLDKFYEELTQEKGPPKGFVSRDGLSSIKPKSTKKVFKYSDDEFSSGNESDPNSENENDHGREREGECGGEEEEEGEKDGEGEIPLKKRRVENDQDNAHKAEKISESRCTTIDKIIEAEIEELGDKEKVKFAGLDSGCNGVVFIRMRKESGTPNPTDLVEYIMNKAAATRKHMSRFILRLLPVELTCYASAEEIATTAKPIVEQHFPTGEDQPPIKFAVLYEARANSGIDRSTIIDTVAKLGPHPHKVDLSNPDKTIVVQIVKTEICDVPFLWLFYNVPLSYQDGDSRGQRDEFTGLQIFLLILGMVGEMIMNTSNHMAEVEHNEYLASYGGSLRSKSQMVCKVGWKGPPT